MLISALQSCHHMPRQNNTDRNGSSFDFATRVAVWQKAQIVPGVDAAVRRKDRCGAWMDCTQYGVTADDGTGWEIDHIRPIAKGGGDELENLQPLQWQNNRHKGDDFPGLGCLVSAR